MIFFEYFKASQFSDNPKFGIDWFNISRTFQYENSTYAEACITHAAKINFPKEKTLEEKFKDWAKGNKALSSPAYFPILAQIAKQHYEKD